IFPHLHPINLPPFPQNQLLRSQPFEESPRKTEVTIHRKMMIKQLAPAVGRPAKVKINGFEMMAINLHNQSYLRINLL
ncbi:hypothetical protein VP01_12861g1, partial [Puccinia sorghi]